ncbi:GDSL-like Lipase/Acylhydrolase family protein [Sphingomonas laterariae]|uniref:GDSL-like Lipase/Acylhydrolase family protein n=1 Tax=Edaphosphingomonas laterariae TaxID=861865 RepID=A0A239CJT0_9SPHN|nr:SGNH/GDSL hydrolase family protein [Sphingomonas laterariae]SNS20496.1 GDSL-like Lipase/Acylhydrolase family protein [Sphingomonas laterariae]
MADKMISELAMAGPLSNSMFIPVAQGGSNFALPAHRLIGAQPFVQLWGDGDSKTGEGVGAFEWAVARLNLDAWVGGRQFGVGGTNTSNSGNNLTSPARMATIVTAIETASATGDIIDVVMTIGTNDVVLANMTSEAIIANIRNYHDVIRAAGCRNLILMSIDPRTNLTATQQGQIASANRAYEDYCRVVADAIFVDAMPWMLDPASPSFIPIGGAGGTFGAVTNDGLHCSAYGIFRKSFAVEAVAEQLYRFRPVELIGSGIAFNSVTAVRGNILGTGGRFVAMGGTDSFTKVDTSSVVGTPPATFTGSGTLNGDTKLTYSVANCADLGSRYGGDWPCINVALSGTPVSTSDIQLAGRYVVFAYPASTRMRGRALVNLNNVTGLSRLRLQTQNVNPPLSKTLGAAGAAAPQHELPTLNGLHALEIVCDPVNAGNSGLNLLISGVAGRPFGGSIDLLGIEWRRADAIPMVA